MFKNLIARYWKKVAKKISAKISYGTNIRKKVIILEWKFWKTLTTFPILFLLLISAFRNTQRKVFVLYTTVHSMQNRANKKYDDV